MKYDLGFMNKKNYRGFTLFELLVSISIIAILIAVASASFGAAQRKARDARRMEDMETIRKAAEQYYMLNNGSYPVLATGWTAGTSWSVGSQIVLQAFPQDPKGVGYTTPILTTPGSTYCICAFSETATGNCANRDCGYSTAGTKNWYCVSNQQ